ncbi:hypothetical protein [Parabacteroides goldsteinii]|uniref:hypothetical protein n=1 Tax=Parabacteroides goldsteinii TaxID=328812 RepID=UPI0038F7FCB2
MAHHHRRQTLPVQYETSIQPDNWNTAAGKAKGRDAGRINALLDDIRSSLNTIYHEMQRRDKDNMQIL